MKIEHPNRGRLCFRILIGASALLSNFGALATVVVGSCEYGTGTTMYQRSFVVGEKTSLSILATAYGKSLDPTTSSCIASGNSISFPITIQPGNIALGTVTVYLDSIGDTTRWTMSGNATFPMPALGAGTYTIGGSAFTVEQYPIRTKFTVSATPEDAKKIIIKSVAPAISALINE